MTLVSWFYVEQVLNLLLSPVTFANHRLVYIAVTEAIMTKIKLAFFLGFITALPVTLWQVWSFLVPALRKIEKIYFTLFVFLSFLLFVTGLLFGFLVVFDLCVKILLHFGGPELDPMLSIGKYISFTVNFLLPFGLIFEMPLASFFLAKLRLINYRVMVKGRKIALLVSIVAASALIASPDIFSVLLMAAPMYLLYELSALIVKLVDWKAARKLGRREKELIAAEL
jgi:sec-independent protein translocase protein TatC